MQQQKLDRRIVIRIAAAAGVDPKTAKKYAFADPAASIDRRGGAEKNRDAVVLAARALGVRP
jgi:hypothetical protein